MMNVKAPLLRVSLIASLLAPSLLLPPSSSSSAQQADARGITAVNIRAEDGKEVRLYDKSYALVIGISDYINGWPKLPGVKSDTEPVSAALERHGFLVTLVMNPNSAQLD